MAKLGDVCIKASSNIAQKDIIADSGVYPIYGASGLIGNVDFYKIDKPYIAVVKDGAGVGRIMKLPAYSSVIGTMQYIIPNDSVDLDYLAYAMEYMNLAKYYSGATIPHIYFKDYQDENINLISIEQQRAISSVLNRIDALTELRKQQLSKLDELVKARFVEMFGDPMFNFNKFNELLLSEVLDVIGGYAFKSEQFEKKGIPILRIGNINTGHFVQTNMVYWRDEPLLDRYRIYPGDLVMSLTGTVGKDDYGNVCILGNDYPVYYLNQRNAKLNLSNDINKYYLAELLKFSKIKKRLTGISRGVRQANISNNDILNLKVPIPPIELQNQFADFVEQIEKLKSEVKQSLDKLETLKKALMQKYFG